MNIFWNLVWAIIFIFIILPYAVGLLNKLLNLFLEEAVRIKILKYISLLLSFLSLYFLFTSDIDLFIVLNYLTIYNYKQKIKATFYHYWKYNR